MMRRFMGAVALAAAMLGGAQASPTPVDFVFNYSGAAVYRTAHFEGYQPTTGWRYQVYGGLNGTGALLGTLVGDRWGMPTVTLMSLGESNYPDFIDGTFSILWHADDINALVGVQSQSDVHLIVMHDNTGAQFPEGISVGQNCRDTPSLCDTGSGTGGNNIPEPSTLPLLALAGLALVAARRRPAQRTARLAHAV